MPKYEVVTMFLCLTSVLHLNEDMSELHLKTVQFLPYIHLTNSVKVLSGRLYLTL